MSSNRLPLTEELDFHYLLGLMPPLSDVPEYAWLPELFSIIGHKSLIDLCKYAGGEYIRIPRLDELLDAVEALQWFYDVNIKHEKEVQGVPSRLIPLYTLICNKYNAQLTEAVPAGDASI